MSGLLLGRVLSVCTILLHNTVSLTSCIVSANFGTCSCQCSSSNFIHISMRISKCSWADILFTTHVAAYNARYFFPCPSHSMFYHYSSRKPSHTQITQRLQSKILRSITKAPWYVSNFTLHNDLHIPFVTTEISRLSFLYHQRLAGHHNALITALTTPPTIVQRLKRQWLTDLPHATVGDWSRTVSPTYGPRRSVISGCLLPTCSTSNTFTHGSLTE